MFLSIVLPAYNEEENIPTVIEELKKKILTIPSVTEWEIIVCDDHSSDQTFNKVKQFNQPNIKALRLSRRSGSHTALRAGLQKSRGSAVLCISADGQDDPDVLSKMIAKLNEGKQIVWALRKTRDEAFLYKLFSEGFYKILKAFSGQQENKINLANADFYLLDRVVVDAVNSCQERNTSLFGLIVWVGFKQDYIEYHRRERLYGSTKWNFKSRMKLAKDWIIAFSGVPLKVITYAGMVFAGIGFIYAAFIFIYSILGYTTPGWAESIILMLISDGIRMIMMGIIGEYLWRTLDETRKRPIYFIEEDTDQEIVK